MKTLYALLLTCLSLALVATIGSKVDSIGYPVAESTYQFNDDGLITCAINANYIGVFSGEVIPFIVVPVIGSEEKGFGNDVFRPPVKNNFF